MKLTRSLVSSSLIFSLAFLSLFPQAIVAQDSKIAIQRGYRTGYSDGYMADTAEAGLRAEIAQVQQQGVAADELTRAKAQLIAGQIYKLDSMFAQAMEIGQLESVGIPYRLNRRMLEKRQAVTAEQIQMVARKYFRDEQLTVAELDPQPLAPTPRARSPFTPRH